MVGLFYLLAPHSRTDTNQRREEKNSLIKKQKNIGDVHTIDMIRRDAVAVFKPAAVPLYSPLQALHGIFDVSANKNSGSSSSSRSAESVASRVLVMLQCKKSAPSASSTATEEEEEEEEVVRVDAKKKQKTSGRFSASGETNDESSMMSVVPDLLLAGGGGGRSSKGSTSVTSASLSSSSSSNNSLQRLQEQMEKKINNSNSTSKKPAGEVHFPIGSPDWFSSGVVLAAATPAAFTFLLHAASVGAVRREYHAVCRVPQRIARLVARSQAEERERARRNMGKFDLNPAIKKFEEWKGRQLHSAPASAASAATSSSSSASSAPIEMSSLLLPNSGGLVSGGYLRGGLARLSDLSLSSSYRPEIDELFVMKKKKKERNDNLQQQELKSLSRGGCDFVYSPLNHWTSKRPHPFLKASDILAPVLKTTMLGQTLGSAVDVSATFSVEGMTLEEGEDIDDGRAAAAAASTGTGGAKLFLKLSVIGLQSEASIRAALAAAGVPVVNDFEYCSLAAKRLHQVYQQHALDRQHQQQQQNQQRKIAVHANRMLTPQESLLLSSWTSSSSVPSSLASSLFGSGVPQLFCSRIVYPDPYSARNVGLLQHMVGANKTTKDLVRAALRRVPSQDTTAQFSCCVADVGEHGLPPSMKVVHEIDDDDEAEKKKKSLLISGRSAVETYRIIGSGGDGEADAASADSENPHHQKDDGDNGYAVCQYAVEEGTTATSSSNSSNGDELDAAAGSTMSGAESTLTSSSFSSSAGVLSTIEQDARELIFSRFSAVSDSASASMPRVDTADAPGIHGGQKRSFQGRSQQQQVRCRFCFGPHHVSQCTKLSARERKDKQFV